MKLFLKKFLFIIISDSLRVIITHPNLTESCGLRIVRFNEPSPAKEAGLQINDVIIRLDGADVKTMDDLNAFMKEINSSKKVIVQTKSGERYPVKPNFDKEEKKFMLGVTLVHKICKK